MSGIIKNEGKFYMASYRISDQQRKPSTKTTNRAAAQTISSVWESIELKIFTKDQLFIEIQNTRIKLVQQLPVKERSKALLHFDKKCQQLKAKYYPVEKVMSFASISEEWLASKKSEIAPSTYSKYCTDIQHFLEYINTDAENSITDFKRAWLSKYQTYLIETYSVSVSTVNLKLKSIKQCLKYCYFQDYTEVNLADKCSPKKKAKNSNGSKNRRAFTDGEFETLLANCSELWKEVCTIGAFTGQRLGDIVMAKISDFDLDTKCWAFTAQKTGREMEVPLRKEIVQILKSHSPSAKYLFPSLRKIYFDKNKKDNSFSSSKLSNQFRDYVLVPAGFQKFKHSSQPSKGVGRRGARTQNELCFHSIRHMATSKLHEHGVPTAIVMDIIGHDDSAVHSGYVKTTHEKKMEAVEKM